MEKKNKKKGFSNTLKIFISLILILIAIYLIYLILFKNDEQEKIIVEEIKVIDKIEKFNYNLDENETDYYKSLFEELSTLVEEENYSEEEYAILLTKLFITDFYTLDNKITKNDIGGLQFVHKDEQEDFIEKAENTIYKYIQSNIYNDRKQLLPKVKNVLIDSLTKEKYSYNDETDKEAYKINVNIEYEKELDYQKKAIIYLVHEDDMLKIVEMKKHE